MKLQYPDAVKKNVFNFFKINFMRKNNLDFQNSPSVRVLSALGSLGCLSCRFHTQSPLNAGNTHTHTHLQLKCRSSWILEAVDWKGKKRGGNRVVTLNVQSVGYDQAQPDRHRPHCPAAPLAPLCLGSAFLPLPCCVLWCLRWVSPFNSRKPPPLLWHTWLPFLPDPDGNVKLSISHFRKKQKKQGDDGAGC